MKKYKVVVFILLLNLGETLLYTTISNGRLKSIFWGQRVESSACSLWLIDTRSNVTKYLCTTSILAARSSKKNKVITYPTETSIWLYENKYWETETERRPYECIEVCVPFLIDSFLLFYTPHTGCDNIIQGIELHWKVEGNGQVFLSKELKGTTFLKVHGDIT